MDELESVMQRAQEYEDLNESHTSGYGAADDLRILYKEVLRLRQVLSEAIAEARAEAIREAAERIYELAHNFSSGEYYSRMKIITALHELAAILAANTPDAEAKEPTHD